MDINHTEYLFHFRVGQKNMNTEQHFLQIHISQPVISKNEFEKRKKRKRQNYSCHDTQMPAQHIHVTE